MSEGLKLKIKSTKRVLTSDNRSNAIDKPRDNVALCLHAASKKRTDSRPSSKLAKRIKLNDSPSISHIDENGSPSGSMGDSKSDKFLIPIDKAKSCVQYTVHVNETYQLGYTRENNSADIYLFEFVDGLEVSYPVSVNSSNEIPEHLPPLFTEPGYSEQLMALATNALESLAMRIDQWLRACQEVIDTDFVWRSLTAHRTSSSLRRQIFTLLTTLVPDAELSEGFDCTSPDVDRLLYRLICQLSSDPHLAQTAFDVDKDTPKNSVPLISLCHEPEHCLRTLREMVITLLHLLLPKLELPGSFDIEKDLPHLIDAVYSYNPQVCDLD